MVQGSPLLTVLVCTYNRCNDLAEMLATAVSQCDVDAASYEVLVVDNNSSDGTAAVVNEFASVPVCVRYVFEPRQGKSYALNRGIVEARGKYYSVIDDDLLMPPTYIRDLMFTIGSNPDAAAVGGKVLPLFKGSAAPWLTQEHWAALGMAGYVEQTVCVGTNTPLCLLAATLRRSSVISVGSYRVDLGVRGRSVIGGTEDSDLLQRLWQAGFVGVYSPSLKLHHKVEPIRASRRYHLRWHYGHGRAIARGRDPDVERSRGYLAGVPLHIIRSLLAAAGQSAAAVLACDMKGALRAGLKLAFAAGFINERLRSG
jgi:glucosyl-dolichyl phosphate glucuronosyltransferase